MKKSIVVLSLISQALSFSAFAATKHCQEPGRYGLMADVLVDDANGAFEAISEVTYTDRSALRDEYVTRQRGDNQLLVSILGEGKRVHVLFCR